MVAAAIPEDLWIATRRAVRGEAWRFTTLGGRPTQNVPDYVQDGWLCLLEALRAAEEAPDHWIPWVRVVVRRGLLDLHVFRPERPNERLRPRQRVPMPELAEDRTEDIEIRIAIEQLKLRWASSGRDKYGNRVAKKAWSDPAVERYRMKQFFTQTQNKRRYDT